MSLPNLLIFQPVGKCSEHRRLSSSSLDRVPLSTLGAMAQPSVKKSSQRASLTPRTKVALSRTSASATGSQQTWSGLRPKKKIVSGRVTGRSFARSKMGGSPAPPKPMLVLPDPEPRDPKMAELSSLLTEIEPPCGVLRVPLTTATEIERGKSLVYDSLELISSELPSASEALGQTTLGSTFQALLARGASSANISAELSSSTKMYASRDDRTAGLSLPLELLETSRIESLASRSIAVVGLLRIKIEDDGDLDQARKTLRDCDAFFKKLEEVGVQMNTGQVELLQRLRNDY